MLGPGRAFDTDRFLVVCANVLGSCYGTCGPTSRNPMTGRPYGGDFPLVTVRDSVHLHSRLLVEHLGVTRVFAVIGGSMGGMQALEWTFVQEPAVTSAVALACNGKHGAWQIGFSGEMHPCYLQISMQAHIADSHYRLTLLTTFGPPSECQRQAILADPCYQEGQ